MTANDTAVTKALKLLNDLNEAETMARRKSIRASIKTQLTKVGLALKNKTVISTTGENSLLEKFKGFSVKPPPPPPPVRRSTREEKSPPQRGRKLERDSPASSRTPSRSRERSRGGLFSDEKTVGSPAPASPGAFASPKPQTSTKKKREMKEREEKQEAKQEEKKQSRLEKFKARPRTEKDKKKAQDRKIGTVASDRKPKPEPHEPFEHKPIFGDMKEDDGKLTDRIDQAFKGGKRRKPVKLEAQPIESEERPFSMTSTPYSQMTSDLDRDISRSSLASSDADFDQKHSGNHVYPYSRYPVPPTRAQPGRNWRDIETKETPGVSDFVGGKVNDIVSTKFDPATMDISGMIGEISDIGIERTGTPLSQEGKSMLEQLQGQQVTNILDSLRNRFRPVEGKRDVSSLVHGEVGNEDAVASGLATVRRLAGQAGSATRGFVDSTIDVIDTIDTVLQPIRQAAGIAHDVKVLTDLLPDRLNPLKTLTEKARSILGGGDDDKEDEPATDQEILKRIDEINGPAAGSQPGQRPPAAKNATFPTIHEGKSNVQLVQSAINAYFNDLQLLGSTEGTGTQGDYDIHRG